VSRTPFLRSLPENSVSCARPVEQESATDLVGRVFALVLPRSQAAEERRIAQGLLDQRGVVELCRAMINLNEFVYVD
jgi:hypothetical protein